ncbi:uncharacterized protein ASPGLDRAFT_53605 [Aspergillus glaucus CBS 516.65]|uniref:Uncharacterized protein n=1 Tax=Aspergillus glaucus CBS 516.65 TaxID=1160497 RepID=A0A1L9V3M7_ASPGL|nr:hypothetical protein ASPGLDRAFT_53605 [Aspergillus glaucus CBS 516.65]OJJ78501.1 hypothetical protein ASPGLDRAFT_53605 [Aspergillus glaucus CBS 516.65]
MSSRTSTPPIRTHPASSPEKLTPLSTITTTTPNPSLPNFTSPTFDPADYLNETLPPLTLASTQPNASRAPGSVPLAELSTQVQGVVSSVNAQNVRYSGALTTLVDEILRGGGRLAYEVEVLRGEVLGLVDGLVVDGEGGDIARFVPQQQAQHEKEEEGEPTETDPETKDEEKATQDPDYIKKLRTLNAVRARLDEVVQTFGSAMEWPLPPSELSLTSSFISVSAPDLGPESQSLEAKGQEMMKKFRTEVNELLDGDDKGVEAAERRVEEIGRLAGVWRGTAEEKARGRFVEGLVKVVEDRRRVLESQGGQQGGSGQQGQGEGQQQRSDGRTTGHRRQESEGPGGGIFRNLQRLRDEIYLD